MADTAKIQTLRDHTTGEAVAPRTVVKALSGEGTVGQIVGYTEDNVVGNITPDAEPKEGSANPVQSGGVYKANKYRSNPNILYNWYFGNPVNQRMQTEYTGSATYSIDRWKFGARTCNLKIDSDESCIVFSGTAETTAQNYSSFIQLFDTRPLDGCTVTFSILYKGTVGLGVYGGTPNGFHTSEDWDIISITYVITINASPNWWMYKSPMFCINDQEGCKVRAAKFELGERQTLAHKESGTWVINDPPPNFNEELAKCQAYYYENLITLPKVGPIGGCAMVGSPTGSSIYGSIQFPVKMRVTPTIKIQTAREMSTNIFHDEWAEENLNYIVNTNGLVAVTGISSVNVGMWYEVYFTADAEI